jgi:hypothetical protein
MKKHNITLIIFLTLVLSILGSCFWIFNDITTKESTWREKEITGYLRDVQLITTFPNEGVYIMFMDGNFTFVTENYFWTYSQLHTIDPTNQVKITYEINGMSRVRVTHIQELSND